MHRGDCMRTTLDLPEDLLEEAMVVSRVKTKTDVIKIALQNLIQKEKIKELKKFYGKINLQIDMNELRQR